MLTITHTAMEHFRKSIKTLAPAPDSKKCIRLKPGQRARLELAFEAPAPTDETFVHGDRVVLAVAQKISEICADKTLDMDENGRITVQ